MSRATLRDILDGSGSLIIVDTLSNGPAAISTLAKAADLDHAKTAKILKALVRSQKIVKTGTKRGTRYQLAA